MLRKLGILLIIIGLSIVGWFGYQHWESMQSVEKIDKDVVKATNTHYSQKKAPEKDSKTETNHVADGDDVATLVLPTINTSYKVYWGTDDKVLAKGVGMYDSNVTTTPDQKGHTILSGHRDSVFSPVGDLENNDPIYVRYKHKDYEYKVKKTWITDADDRSVIVGKEDPTLTLTTCYPFQYIGDAPDRYIIEAKYVKEGDLLNI